VLPVVVVFVVFVVVVEVPGSAVPAMECVVEDSVFGSVGEAGVSVPALGVAPESAVAAVPGDWELPLDEDELADVAESSAHATPFPVAMAVPIPNATARRPTRPT
jgi:hypothetical protein